MYKFSIKKLVALILSLAVMSYTVLGFCHVYKKQPVSLTVKKIVSNLYFDTHNLNKLTDKIQFADDFTHSKDNAPAPEKKAGKENMEIMFFISTFAGANNGLLILMNIAFFSLLFTINKAWKNIYIISPPKPPDIVFYKNWILKFLTPVQKCILNRSDEYDINPITILMRELTRALNEKIFGARVF